MNNETKLPSPAVGGPTGVQRPVSKKEVSARLRAVRAPWAHIARLTGRYLGAAAGLEERGQASTSELEQYLIGRAHSARMVAITLRDTAIRLREGLAPRGHSVYA